VDQPKGRESGPQYGLTEKQRAWLRQLGERVAALEAEVQQLTAKKRSPRKDTAPTPEETTTATHVLDRLNHHAGTKLRSHSPSGPTSNLLQIVKRLRQGFTAHDLKLVAWHRSQEWKDDEQMSKFLRPSTLYGTAKFDEYLDQARAAFEAATGEDPDELTEDNAPAEVIQLAEMMRVR